MKNKARTRPHERSGSQAAISPTEVQSTGGIRNDADAEAFDAWTYTSADLDALSDLIDERVMEAAASHVTDALVEFIGAPRMADGEAPEPAPEGTREALEALSRDELVFRALHRGWWDFHTMWMGAGCPEEYRPGPQPKPPPRPKPTPEPLPAWQKEIYATMQAHLDTDPSTELPPPVLPGEDDVAAALDAALERLTAEAQPTVGGWGPVDLSGYVDGTHTPEPASILKRTDGVGLLYPGKVHAFNGEPESGKSMLAQWVVAVELDAGHDVLVLDYESDAATYVERLMAMGVARHVIVGHLSYLNPETDPTKNPAARAAMEGLLASKSYTLAVLDGVTEALALAGADTNSSDDYTLWHKMVPRRIAKAGAAVVVVDHVTKATDGRGRFAIGSQAKLATLTGAAYLVDVKRPLGRGVVGELSLKVAKDRPGYVRGNAGRWSASTRLQEAARVLVDGTVWGRIAVAVNPPVDDTDDDGEFRPTGLMAKVCRVLEANGKPMALKPLREAVGGNSENIGKAIDMLRAGEYITVDVGGPGKPTIHTLVKIYTEDDDPKLAGKRARTERSRFMHPEGGSHPAGDPPLKGGGPPVQVGETWTGQGSVQVGPGGLGTTGGMGWKPPTLPVQVPGAEVEA